MFACFYLPDFPIQASLLMEPSEARVTLKQSPVVILDGSSSSPRVFALNDGARKAGVQVGMMKLQAETCGGAVLRKRSEEVEEEAQSKLIDYASTFSPRVEATNPGTAIMDLAGTERLFGSWERMVAMATAKAFEIGFDVRVAIAANPDTAFFAAKGFSKNAIVPTGEEVARLAGLHVDLLPILPEMLEILDRWGIRTFQELASLPSVAVVERLGQEGLHLQKLACGQVNRTLLTVEAIPEFIESFEFDDPVEKLESVLFVLNRMLQQLCLKLISSSLATTETRLSIELVVRQIHDVGEAEQYKHEWKLPFPTQDRNWLFNLVRLHLEQVIFTAPIRGLAVELIPVKPRVAQGDLFAPPSPEPEKLEITLERIRGVVGNTDADGIDCVGSPRLLDTHKPGSFAVEHLASRNDKTTSWVLASVIALRMFRPAIETSVELDGEKPHFVKLWRMHRRVLAASGPWLNSGSWWNASAWEREEWDVALKATAGIGFYRIYHDRIRQQWFVEGIFD